MADNPSLLPSEQPPEILQSHIEMDIKKLETTNDLPLELLIEILSCLPVKPLLRFKCVSKSLYNIINSPDFVKLHLSRSLQAHSEGTLIVFGYTRIHTFGFNDSPGHATELYCPDNFDYLHKLVGSCNGLLCFSCQVNEVTLLNPATAACKNLPKVKLTNKFMQLSTPLGFGYDCITNDYKVLKCARLQMSNAGITQWQTLLYSLSTNAWVIIQNPPWSWGIVILTPAIAANNSLHWMDHVHKKIKCFDLFTQRYYEIPLHEKISPGNSSKLCVLRGQLCIVTTFCFDIWILKEYGVQDSWTRLFHCPSGEWSRLYNSSSWHTGFTILIRLSVACSKDGSKILVALRGDPPNFICYIEMDMINLDRMEDLPLELLEEILSCLPVKPLLRFKCVSKSLYNIINSPDFVKLHLSRSLQAHLEGTLIVFGYTGIHTFDFNDSPCHATGLYCPGNFDYLRKLVGSCNGLLCFSCQANEVALLNPATRACKQLPQVTLTNMFMELCSPLGFGYDCIFDDYKVLRYARLREPSPFAAVRNMPSSGFAASPKWETLLYSLRTDAWESIQNPPWTWETVITPGIVANNSLHWMSCDFREVKCFHLFTQSYYEIPLPEKISPGYKPALCLLRGKLCVVTFYLDIWILEDYDVQGSWTRLFHCPSENWNSLYNSLSMWKLDLSAACSKDGSKILLAMLGDKFICCDLKSKEARMIQIPGLPPKFSAILPWVESLVPVSGDVMN